MSKSFRRETAKKLQEIINTATDPTIIIEAANALSKYLPKPKSPQRRRGTPTPKQVKEPTVEDMIRAVEKKRKGIELTETEKQMVAAVEKKRKESCS